MPETTQEIFSYLSSRAVKGIGAKTAAKIVERFGAQSLDVLENEPSRLAEIPGHHALQGRRDVGELSAGRAACAA